jgi:integrase
MLTKTEIDSAIKNCTKERILNDGASGRGGGSLQLRLRPGKDKSVAAAWIVSWKQDGKRGSKQIGRYPGVTLAAARDKFRDGIRPALLDKKNPKAAAAVCDEKPTVEALFKRYVAHLKAREAGAAKHIEQVLLLGKYNAADALGRDKLACDVDTGDVRLPLVAAAKRGALRTADILRTYMASAFSWGMKSANDYTTENNYDWGIKTNPVAAVPRDQRANKTRERNLTGAEMSAVWHAAPAEQSGDVIRLIMLCGQRVQETIKVDGCEIDLYSALWNMPAKKTKGRKFPHTIPLPAQAIEIFKRLIELYGDGPLFPARTGSKAARMGFLAVTHCTARLTVCKPFTPRDLRRTWKSRTADAGIDRFMRDLIQQHARNDTGSKFYDRASYLKEMRAAMDKWGEWMANNVVKSHYDNAIENHYAIMQANAA